MRRILFGFYGEDGGDGTQCGIGSSRPQNFGAQNGIEEKKRQTAIRATYSFWPNIIES
jgi:hypothetical protein